MCPITETTTYVDIIYSKHARDVQYCEYSWLLWFVIRIYITLTAVFVAWHTFNSGILEFVGIFLEIFNTRINSSLLFFFQFNFTLTLRSKKNLRYFKKVFNTSMNISVQTSDIFFNIREKNKPAVRRQDQRELIQTWQYDKIQWTVLICQIQIARKHFIRTDLITNFSRE